jgi:RNA polymerase sigma-70 factor (ECF subfamily)
MPADPLRDDEQLVAALRRGDEQAFASLVRQWGPSLMRVALQHVPSRAVAEEVVQETWVGVLNGLDRFEGRSSFRRWVFQILLNTAHTRGARERRTLPFAALRRWWEGGTAEWPEDPRRFQGALGERPGWWADPPVRWQAPEQQLESEETRRVMLEAIAALPARQREIITLRDIEGWSPEEVCDALDISEGNQRVLLHRARSKVRQALERHLGEEGRP